MQLDVAEDRAFGEARSFVANDIIFEDDDPAMECFLVDSGSVRIVKAVRGRERTLALLGAAAFFGEAALIPSGRHTARAVAEAEVRLRAFSREQLTRLLSTEVELATRLTEALARRLGRTEQLVEISMLRDESSKVICTLFHLATQEGTELIVKEAPVALASRTGLRVEAVKRIVRQLRDSGYLLLRGNQIVVLDALALRQLYDLLGRKDAARSDIG